MFLFHFKMAGHIKAKNVIMIFELNFKTNYITFKLNLVLII